MTVANASLWGPWIWKALHLASIRYDPDSPLDRRHMRNLVYDLPYLLPCGKCIRHYKELVHKYPPRFGSRDDITAWYIDIHNRVNEHIKKAVLSRVVAQRHIKTWRRSPHLRRVVHSIVQAYTPLSARKAQRLLNAFVYFLSISSHPGLGGECFTSKAKLVKALGDTGLL